MAILRSYKCPDCAGVFEFLHHPQNEPPPSHCPLCGADVSGAKKKRKTRLEVKITKAPAIKGVASRSVDGLYRGMENAAEQRRQEAAALLGVDVRSLSGMKMTNMKDNLREGDMSYMPAAATKIHGEATDFVRSDTGKPLGATFGMQNAEYALPGKPSSELSNMMNSTFANHQNRVQATVAAGKKT